MKPRMDYVHVSPGASRAMFGLTQHVHQSGLEPSLIHLIDMRVSQINGCAFCLDMHWKDSKAAGESDQRLYSLNAWQETSYYTERERAALAWAEAVTAIADGHVPDELYEATRKHFSEKELVDLTMAVIAINGWNRLSISFRTEPGTYQPKMVEEMKKRA